MTKRRLREPSQFGGSARRYNEISPFFLSLSNGVQVRGENTNKQMEGDLEYEENIFGRENTELIDKRRPLSQLPASFQLRASFTKHCPPVIEALLVV